MIAAILVKIDSPRENIIFKQQRAGRFEKPFKIYKFRSMSQSGQINSKERKVYNWENGVPDDFVFKSASGTQPNVSKIGHFLRKSSLDELPQLWNVLKGDMSIVGPRPEILDITKCYSEKQKERLHVYPGITGWAQVNGRSNMNHGQKIKLDVYYVDNISMKLDFTIILLTIKQVLSGKDAV
ncbi:sugar transferase [Listeria fleischmannii]|uniref:sugar transferase n=1 Tax=Listeria fleischmannii TaxID=1069827 RepID=UPI0021ACACDA|nr:sugar transferase [Listeria fleischmannii]